LFALSYTRKVMQDGQDIDLYYASPLFADALARHGKTEAEIEVIAEKVAANGGSCQLVEEVPQSLRHVFVVAADVTPEEHVWTQAVLQAFVDNSISKTINLPNSATTDDVSNAYKMAFELGCKGITVYRQGSRQIEVLSTKAVDEWPVIRPKKIPEYARERGLIGRVYPVETAFGKVQVTITELEAHTDRPFDVRLQIGKGGNDKNADVEAIGRMISLALRSGVAVEAVVDQLEGIGGQSFLGMGDHRVRSVADGIAKLLSRRYLDRPFIENPGSDIVKTYTVDQDRVCPKCHNATLVMEAGCRHCEIRLGGCGEYEGCD
jgi:ribonucleoside-diphosphate reductase alpha chain